MSVSSEESIAEPLTLRVLDIVAGTSVDGPGLRTSIYFAGCDHRCPGCHNPESWSHDAGREMTVEEIMAVVRENDFNVTFSGGDPLYQRVGIEALARAVKAEGYTLWCYTGFTFEQLMEMEGYRDLVAMFDVLVDGPFIEKQRDISLHFRGSANQRLIDVPATLAASTIALWQP
jgi:anaerobic ribonucleoside-triphosphate reductase activating protein